MGIDIERLIREVERSFESDTGLPIRIDLDFEAA